MQAHRYSPGDWVIYRKQKYSASPGPRASNVASAPNGDTYSYIVEKFWVVREVLADGRLQLCTRRGKTHVVDPADSNLHLASFWKRWLYKDRFREIESAMGRGASS